MVLKEYKDVYFGDTIRLHCYKDELNRMQGMATFYYLNGNINSIEYVLDGKNHGERISYTEDGELKYHDIWLHGNKYADYSELSGMDRFELSLKHGIIWHHN